jgi:hypothetical protein
LHSGGGGFAVEHFEGNIWSEFPCVEFDDR